MQTTARPLLSLFSAAALLAASATVLRAQSALDGFDPNANGVVNVAVVQPDGKILLGGSFTTLAPNGGPAVTRNRIARLNPDGTLDAAFNPSANSSVQTIAVQADGKILVGGNFFGASSIGGQTRNYLARLDPTTGAADSFDPNADNVLNAIALQADGKILVGGAFSSIGGQTRNQIARLDPTTGAADSFNPNADNSVVSFAIQADGKILAGGFFSTIGGQARNRIARLDPTTGAADSFNPNASGVVAAIAIQADGKILAAGSFFGANSIGGQTRNRIARLDPTTGLADSFNPNADASVSALVIQTDGAILVGGSFANVGGQARSRMARLDAGTGLADAFSPNPSIPTAGTAFVATIAVQSNGRILAGGFFTTIAGQTRNSIARLAPDGRLDQTLANPAINGLFFYAAAVQPDGKILIGGNFDTVLGVTRNNIARLNSDGTLDTAFNPNANGAVESIVVLAGGKILIGGGFASVGGQARGHIARLDGITGAPRFLQSKREQSLTAITLQTDGLILVGGTSRPSAGKRATASPGSIPPPAWPIRLIPTRPAPSCPSWCRRTGKILVGGLFNGTGSIGGQTRNYIARLDPITGLADSFNPNANAGVQAIALQPDGKILVGGSFNGASSIGGQVRNRIARLDPATGLADSFNPNADGAVVCLVLQADGKVLAAGSFSNVSSSARRGLARLSATTGMPDSFNPNTSSGVNAVALQTDGKVLAGGTFASIGGQSRGMFGRLTNDTSALQNLSATQNEHHLDARRFQPAVRPRHLRVFQRQRELRPARQRHRGGQQLDPDRFEPPPRTELLHPRSRLLCQRRPKHVGEHRRIRAECFPHHGAGHHEREQHHLHRRHLWQLYRDGDRRADADAE